ncbi:MAG: Z1 domain-containing protein, partial [Candidatus Pacebacteria bacterium]|nr:Z1 domain-containing protein [Candidatus Paceibacterota bacterium]
QKQVNHLVEKELRHLAARIMSGEELDDFRDIWENDYLPATKNMLNLDFNDAVEHSWKEIVDQLHQTTRMVKVKLINGSAKDSLDYKDAEIENNHRIQNGENIPWEEKGISVIVIGGDKLSRGLTLEGLSISYYIRTTKMYDTLMQMGRWFGYREGYNDLCRIYMTDELFSWYRHIAGATKELKEEIDLMSTLNLTPTEFGLKIRSHPGRLVVTSAAKSRNATRIELSYAGRISETIVFDKKHIENNLCILHELVKNIGRSCDKEYDDSKPRYHWKNVHANVILNFLHKYRLNDSSVRLVKPQVLAKYIEQQNKNEELIEWDVVIVSKSGNEPNVKIGDYNIVLGMREAKISTNSITIKRLVSKNDELLDLSDEELEEANLFYKSNDNIKTEQIAARHVRPGKRGLLLIYI